MGFAVPGHFRGWAFLAAVCLSLWGAAFSAVQGAPQRERDPASVVAGRQPNLQQKTGELDASLQLTDSRLYLPVVAAVEVSPTLNPAEEVLIPAGPFLMGCDSSLAWEACRVDERPLHRVELDAYAIDRYEVTNARYQACVEAGVCRTPRSRGSNTRSFYYGNPVYANYPVLHTNWHDARNLCSWEGKRLPTEAEWEKAARGETDTRMYPWGDEPRDCTLGNFDVVVEGRRVWCVGDTTEIGTYPAGASPYGAMDMAGNVREWVNDLYASNYYSFSPIHNPQGPATGSDHLLRGGSWDNHFDYMRVARRVVTFPERSNNLYGFRCARSLP